MACSLFDLTIRGYKPSAKDFVSVVAVDIAYALMVVPLNTAFGWNYGYLGDSKPDGRTIIDILGPWPQRIPIILGVVVLMQLSMLALWTAHQKARDRMNRSR